MADERKKRHRRFRLPERKLLLRRPGTPRARGPPIDFQTTGARTTSNDNSSYRWYCQRRALERSALGLAFFAKRRLSNTPPPAIATFRSAFTIFSVFLRPVAAY